MTDIRFAFRQLLKNPGFTAVAVLTLALGIGVNTSMFSALQTLLSRRLAYPRPEGLVQVFQTSPQSQWQSHHSAPNLADYQRSGAFALLAAFTDKSFNLSFPGEAPERVSGLMVSPDLFPLLGVQPLLGRWFSAGEELPGQSEVVILDHAFWRQRFAGDPEVIGRTLRLDGEPVTVVGVMPESFHDPLLMGSVSLWKPLAIAEPERSQRGHSYLKCIARLPAGQTLNDGQSAASGLAARQRGEHPQASPDGLRLVPLAESSLPPQARQMVWLVMALAGFVLLIACANLANLQCARTLTRGRELAIRGALGASQTRLLGQLLGESLLLAALGGAAGVILACMGNALLGRLLPANGPMLFPSAPDSRVLLFALAVTTVSGAGIGLIPAWLAIRRDSQGGLQAGSRGSSGDRTESRLQHGLIIAQVSLALMLLAGAGFVVNGLRAFAGIHPGWDVQGLTMGQLTLPQGRYPDGDRVRGFTGPLLDALRALPGARGVALCWNLPVRQFNVTSSFAVDGRPDAPQGQMLHCSVNGVSPGYFEVLGMRVLAGRGFFDADLPGQPPVVIINERLARTYWPDASPIGQRLNGAEIVGVVNDVRFPANPAELRSPYQTYRPLAQEPRPFLSIALRGDVGPEALRRVVQGLDPDQPVGNAGPASAEVARSLDHWGAGGHLLTAFALLGLLLAALGIYGVLSGYVARRTGEIGVRVALGAQLGDVFRMIMGRGLRLVLAGAVLGAAGSAGILHVAGTLLPGVPSGEIPVLGGVLALLLAAASLACWLPARRAARVDPMVALRNE